MYTTQIGNIFFRPITLIFLFYTNLIMTVTLPHDLKLISTDFRYHSFELVLSVKKRDKYFVIEIIIYRYIKMRVAVATGNRWWRYIYIIIRVTNVSWWCKSPLRDCKQHGFFYYYYISAPFLARITLIRWNVLQYLPEKTIYTGAIRVEIYVFVSIIQIRKRNETKKTIAWLDCRCRL